MNAGFSLAQSVRAELAFSHVGARTHLSRQLTPHPFHITRPFYHPNDPRGMATLYLQSSSGGLYGDDDLGLSISVGPGAAAHLTTQASTIVHDARGRLGAVQVVTLEIGADGWLEYLPDPTILMAGARLGSRVEARVDEGARLFLADAQICHDPEGSERPFEHLDSQVLIAGPDGTRLLDRFDLDGTDWLTRTGGYPCAGTVLIVGGLSAAPAMLRAVNALPGVYAGLSTLADRDIALVRFLAVDGVALSKALTTSWAAVRLAQTGQAPSARRK